MEKKLSHYLIFTEKFEIDNKGTKRIIVFSTRSSQALVITENIYQNLVTDNFANLTPEILEKFENLKIIVPSNEDELATIIDENHKAIQDDGLLYYVIQPTAYCQLGCDYCGQDHKKKNISNVDQEKLIERIKGKIIKGKHWGIKIGWFGAEPLVGLKEIRELTPKLKKLASENNLSYSSKVVTNGLSLKKDIFKELVEELDVKHIEITLDGIAEFHDKRRHTKNEDPTFEIIFNNLKQIVKEDIFQERKCDISIRCNVDERNFDGVSPLIRLLAESQLQDKISHFYPIGVYSWGNDAHLKSLTKEEFATKEIDWLIEMYEVGFKPPLLPGRVKSVCLAVSPTSEMIDAYGNIFNCTEVSYVPAYYGSEFILGNLKDTTEAISKMRPLSNWNDRVFQGDFQCNTCKMLPVCGGACPKSWEEGRRACPSNKFNIKEKLLLSYLVTRDNFAEILEKTN